MKKQFGGLKSIVVIMSLSVAALLNQSQAAKAFDESGIHAFQNDDRNQFADFWLNRDHNTITIKASNGRPWRPMWIVLHATFIGNDNTVIDKRDYHIFCPSPTPGGHGAEHWFIYPNTTRANVTNTARIQLSSNKEKPWGKPSGGWEIQIPIYPPPSIPKL